MSTIQLTIVVPAYHESKLIEGSLEQLAKAIKQYLDYDRTEVIVVSADDSDPTADLAESKAKLFKHFSVIRPGARVGKGRDVRLGILAGKGEYRMFMDADIATPLHHLSQIAEFIKNNGEMGIGSRKLGVIHTGLRKYISEVGNVAVQTLLVRGIEDSQCGFKIFRADVAQALFSRMTILNWGFDMELLVIARKHGLTITKMPIPDWHDPKADEEGFTGDSNARFLISTGIEMLKIVSNRILNRYK
jgi:dolichyl-phosphate beta-glucosyltransferase